MSKMLSLKVKDDVFAETEDIIESIHKPRNAYINEALSFYNKFIKRRLLKKQLKKESQMISASSMEALRELELIEDEMPE
jgi:predicted transcriptional regulator